jgi:hypothetical protein
MKRYLAFLLCSLVAAHAFSQAKQAGAAKDGPEPVPTYSLRISDPATLPIGVAGSPVSAIFGCADDGTVFLQVFTLPNDASPGDVALYGVKGPDQIVRFTFNESSDYRAVSPIVRYFAADSGLLAMAYALPNTETDATDDSKQRVAVMLMFDRKGALKSSFTLPMREHPEQVAVFSSGDLLLAGYDQSRKRTFLRVADPKGSLLKEISLSDGDPGDEGERAGPLTDLVIYGYGKDLLLIPQDTHRPILEVNESGVVNTYKLQVPKGYERGLVVSIKPGSWKFRMLAEASETPAPPTAGQGGQQAMGLESLQNRNGAILEFDPGDGKVLRRIELPSSGMQPACETGGDYIFLSAQSGNGKLQIAHGSIVR